MFGRVWEFLGGLKLERPGNELVRASCIDEMRSVNTLCAWELGRDREIH